MTVRVRFTRYYEYEVEGDDLDECLEVAETALDNESRSRIAESGYDDVEYDIIEDDEEEDDAEIAMRDSLGKNWW